MGFLKHLPIVGDVVKVLDRPGDILKNPLGTLLPLGMDALTIGGLPGVGGPLAGLAKSASPFMKYAGLAGSLLHGAGGMGGGGFGNAVNGVGSMFGVKPFGGGQYQDGGYGNDVNNYTHQLGGGGGNMLNWGSQGIPNSANLLTQMVGLPNPNGPMTLNSNPWTPNQMQQEAVNRQNDAATEDASSMKSRIKQQLMANGITDPEHINAAMSHVNLELAKNKNANLGNAQSQAFNNRMNVANSLPGIYQNAASLGMNGLGSAGGLAANNAQQAFGMRRYNDANLMGGLVMNGSGRLQSMLGLGGNRQQPGIYSPSTNAGSQRVQGEWNAMDNQFGTPEMWMNGYNGMGNQYKPLTLGGSNAQMNLPSQNSWAAPQQNMFTDTGSGFEDWGY
jgi:hypothetical protein